MKMDFSKFKKISADKEKAILKHKDGHEIHIAIKALDPKSRGEIARMETHKEDKKPDADQGKAKLPMKKDKEDKSKKPSAQQGEYLMMNEGGEVPGISKGDENFSKYMDETFFKPSADARQQRYEAEQASLPKTADQDPIMNPGGMPQMAASDPMPGQLTPPPGQQGASSLASPEQGLSQSPGLAPPGGLAQQAPQQAPQDPTGITSAMGMMSQGMQQQAAAEGELGRKQAAVMEKQAAQQQEALEHFNNVGKEINTELTNVIADYKAGHIDPNRYVNSMGTMQKVDTAIGLILGGMGAGMTHSENPAMKFLNDQINRDVQAQQADQDKKFNLVNAYSKQFGNAKDAADMARVTLGGIAVAKMEAAAANSKDPLAKAAMLKAMGNMMASYAPMVTAIQARQGIKQAANAGAPSSAISPMLDQLRIVNPESAKEIEGRYVPGVGLADVPVTPEVRKELVAKTNLVRSTAALRDWVAKNGHSADPRVRAEGETLAAELQQIYRQGVGASTSEGEQAIIEKIIDSNPAKILTMTVDPKLKALEHSMTRSLNTLKEQNQLPQSSVEQQRAGQLPPQQQQWVKWAQDPKNADNPKAKMLLQKLGIQ